MRHRCLEVVVEFGVFKEEVTAVDNRFGKNKAHLKAGTVLWAGKEKILRRGESLMGGVPMTWPRPFACTPTFPVLPRVHRER